MKRTVVCLISLIMLVLLMVPAGIPAVMGQSDGGSTAANQTADDQAAGDQSLVDGAGGIVGDAPEGDQAPGAEEAMDEPSGGGETRLDEGANDTPADDEPCGCGDADYNSGGNITDDRGLDGKPETGGEDEEPLTGSAANEGTIGDESALVADFDFVIECSACRTKSVQFTDRSTGGTGDYTYDWDFGDGTKRSKKQDPMHWYSTDGDYSVTLTVTDSDGNIASTSQIVTIGATGKESIVEPLASDASTTAAGSWPRCVSGCTANDATITYIWLVANPNCTPGTPTTAELWATFEVTRNNGICCVVSVVDIYVNGILVEDDYITRIGDLPSKGTYNRKITDITWTCGSELTLRDIYAQWIPKGGQPCPTCNGDCTGYDIPSKCYYDPGPYQVHAPLIADFEFDFAPDGPCFCHNTTFTDKTSGGVPPYTYEWDFGGSYTYVGEDPTNLPDPVIHYDAPDTYRVTLIVTDHNGSRDDQSYNVTVYPRPTCVITAPPSVCEYSTGNAASVPNAGTGASYNWIITGGTITSSKPYTNEITWDAGGAGNATIGVSVTNAYGCECSNSVEVAVLPCVAVTLDKSATPASVSVAGTVITYTYTVTNSGNVTLTGVSVTDDKLGVITLDKTTLAPGESASGTASYNVTQADIDAGNDIVNAATANSSQGVSDDDSAVVTVEQQKAIEIDKTATPASVSVAGTVITYTYTVTNSGNVTLTGVSVTDDKLGVITLDKTTLAPGESASGTASYNVTQADIDAGNDIVNTATASSSQGASDQDSATVTIEQQKAVQIEKTATPTTVSVAGTIITYTYAVTNSGNVTLTGVSVTDDKLGAITLDKTTLLPGESTTGTASYNVTQADIDAGNDIVNVATASSSQGASGHASATVTIAAGPRVVGPAAGGGGCPSMKYLTVDWEGCITEKPLYSNDRLIVDLLGPSPDGVHNLLLERGTHAPVVGAKTHYLIIVRQLENPPAAPENTVAVVAFNVTPSGAVFDRDILLTLGLDQAQLPQNTQNVTMAYYDNVKVAWVSLPYEAGGPNGVAELTLSAPINHFSIFGVLATVAPPPPPPPAHFVFSGLNIVRAVEKNIFVTRVGKTVTITASVSNDGGQAGTYSAVLKLNGKTVDTQTGTLSAGQSRQVTFTQSGLGYGRYEVEVAGLHGDFTVSRTIAWWLIAVIGVALGLIIWGVIWSRRRRRTQEATE